MNDPRTEINPNFNQNKKTTNEEVNKVEKTRRLNKRRKPLQTVKTVKRTKTPPLAENIARNTSSSAVYLRTKKHIINARYHK